MNLRNSPGKEEGEDWTIDCWDMFGMYICMIMISIYCTNMYVYVYIH